MCAVRIKCIQNIVFINRNIFPRRVQKVVTHRNFDKFTYEYDIALLEMQSSIKFQPNIIPICLPNSDSNLVGQVGMSLVT